MCCQNFLKTRHVFETLTTFVITVKKPQTNHKVSVTFYLNKVILGKLDLHHLKM